MNSKARVRWRGYRVPFLAPYVTSRGIETHREGLIVEVISDSGAVGYGEAALLPEVPDAALLLARVFQQMMTGASSAGPPGTQDDEVRRALLNAIETAAWDGWDAGAELEGRAVYPVSPWDRNDAHYIEINALIATDDPRDAARAAAEARAAGYRTVKLKVAVLDTVDAESDRVGAVREALGPDLKLRLDPNGGWSVDEAIEAIRALERYGIEYVEQPVAPGSIEALGRVQQAVSTPIATDEDVTGPEAARRIIEAGAANVLVVKPQYVGGPRAALEIIDLATAAGVGVVVTSSIETGIGVAAAAHLAACAPGGYAHGLSTLDLMTDDLIEPGLRIGDGKLLIPHGTGLGVSLDEAALDRFATGPWQVAR